MKAGKKPRKGVGPSPEVAAEMLSKESHATKSKFAKQSR